jgi:predicted dehydrogenase
MKRRDFVKNASVMAAGTMAVPSLSFTIGKLKKVKLGIIGTGMRGRSLTGMLIDRDDTEIIAICDIDQKALNKTQDLLASNNLEEAASYTGSENAWEDLIQRDDLDAIIIATPWVWHAPMAMASMKAGKYVGVEVPAALTVEDCFELVRVSEETGMPCMLMENVCYRRDVLAVYNMVKQGLFGELIHMECGYQHDLRHVKFNDGKQPYGGGVEFGAKGFSEASWRTNHSLHRNGDLYPTHGVGPVSKMLDINAGNRFTSISSFATKSRGLNEYIIKNGGEDHPNAHLPWKLGDVVTSILKTSNEETVTIQHDTNLPRPYSLGFRVQGTRGLWMDVNDSIHLEGASPEHRWEPAATYLDKFDHPLWRKMEAEAEGAGHGGMDYFVVNAFVESVKRGTNTPIDVYDAATWSAIIELSEQSIARGSAPVEFPDFTGGRWVTTTNLFAMGGEY